MDRRKFIKVCTAGAVLVGMEGRLDASAHAGEVKEFNRVKLVDGQGNPIKAKQLSTKEAYLFQYPFMGTPCFLINLPNKPAADIKLTADSGDYTWQGGVGPDGKIVAFTAICAHQLSYPTKESAPINYYADEKSEVAGKAGVIVCCEHDRVYDPAQGGKMVAQNKKATQPLAAISLEYDPASDELYAKGVYGGERFADFFKSYKRELLQEYGPGVAKQDVAETTAAIPISQYSHHRDQC